MKIIWILIQRLFIWVRRTLPGRGKPVAPEAFSGYVALCPHTVVELIIADKTEAPFGGKLLLHYRGGTWNAWHTIGGFVFAGESMYEACRRHAADLGIEIEVVKSVGQGGIIGWREDITHPYGWDNNGHLVHHYFLCRVVYPVIETIELQWFAGSKEPRNFARGHEEHIKAYYNLE